MNSEEFRQFGKRSVDYVADYLDNIRDRYLFIILIISLLELILINTTKILIKKTSFFRTLRPLKTSISSSEFARKTVPKIELNAWGKMIGELEGSIRCQGARYSRLLLLSLLRLIQYM